MTSNPEYPYRPLATLVSWLSLVLLVQAVNDGTSAGIDAYDIYLLGSIAAGSPVPAETAAGQDTIQRVLAAISLGLIPPAVTLLLVWVYRVNGNARALGAKGMEYTPGWSVGWFFVPIWGLFKPYLALKEIWQASIPSPDGNWRRATVPRLLGVWWCVGIFNAMLQYSAWPVLSGQRTLAWRLNRPMVLGRDAFSLHLQEFYWGRLSSHLVDFLASVLAIAVVLRLSHLQERRYAANNLRSSEV